MAIFSFIPSSGPTVTFSRLPPYILQSRPEGLTGIPQEDRLVRAPQQQGATRTDTKRKERYISIPLILWSDTETASWASTEDLLIALNPDLGEGAFRATLPDGKIREILAKGEDGTPWIGPATNYTLIPGRVDLLCSNPNFYDPTEISTTFTLGQTPQENQKILTNSGHIPAPFEVTFNGPVEQPRFSTVSPTNFRQIWLNHTLVAGETVVVTTGPGAPSVIRTLSGGQPEGAMRLATLTSQYFSLPLGQTELVYNSDDEAVANRGTVVVKHKNWYDGI